MKRKRMYFAFVLLVSVVICGIVFISCYFRTERPLIFITEGLEFHVSNIELGSNTISMEAVNIEQLKTILCEQKGTVRLFEERKLEIFDYTIRIDGNDSKGPIHIVLNKNDGFIYRNGTKIVSVISNSEDLYSKVYEILT